jgi:hypothetical protein
MVLIWKLIIEFCGSEKEAEWAQRLPDGGGGTPLALPGNDTRSVGCAACSLDIIPTTVFQLPATTNVMKTENSRYWGTTAWNRIGWDLIQLSTAPCLKDVWNYTPTPLYSFMTCNVVCYDVTKVWSHTMKQGGGTMCL